MRRTPIAFACFTAAYGIGPEQRDDYLLVCGTGDDVCAQMRAAGHRAIAVDGIDGAPTDRLLSSAHVVSTDRVRAWLAEHDCTDIVPFKPSVAFSRAAQHLGYNVLAAAPRLVRQLENKLELPAIAEAAGVRAPATTTCAVNRDALRAAIDTLGPRIFQPAVGFAGGETVLLDSEHSIDELLAATNAKVGKLCEFVSGTPLTVNGVVVDDKLIVVGSPTTQLTGLVECTDRAFGSCGNDWTQELGAEQAAEVRRVARAVGTAIAQRGFRGTFGIDVVAAADGSIVLIELNPRFTASQSLTHQLQQRAGLPSLFDAHLTAFGRGEPGDHNRLREAYPDAGGAPHPIPTGAASVIIYNTSDAPIPGRDDMAAGAWLLHADSAPERSHDAWRIDQLAPGEALVFAQSACHAVKPHGELARIVLSGSALNPHGELETALSHAVASVRATTVAS